LDAFTVSAASAAGAATAISDANVTDSKSREKHYRNSSVAGQFYATSASSDLAMYRPGGSLGKRF
jgi:hypothetical protein